MKVTKPQWQRKHVHTLPNNEKKTKVICREFIEIVFGFAYIFLGLQCACVNRNTEEENADLMIKQNIEYAS